MERKELIEKAIEWLKENACYYARLSFDENYDYVIDFDAPQLIQDFRKFLEK